MVRRFHRSIYEFDDRSASMDYLFQLAFKPIDNPMLPEGEQPDIPFLYPCISISPVAGYLQGIRIAMYKHGVFDIHLIKARPEKR